MGVGRFPTRHGLRQYCTRESLACLPAQGGLPARDGNNFGKGIEYLALQQSTATKEAPKVEEDKNQLRDQAFSESELENMFDASSSGVDLSCQWGEAMQAIHLSEQLLPQQRPSPEELVSIRASRPTMTLGSLIQESDTLKRLVDLGVGLHIWDREGHLGLAAKLDFDRDVVHIIRFLSTHGVNDESLGPILTWNPGLLEEELEDLNQRVLYLQSKKFTRQEIAILITQSPMWLSFPVPIIDARLGFFQKSFGLSGAQVRHLALKAPRLITWKGNPLKVRKQIFGLNEEMGFTREELRDMVLQFPQLLMADDEQCLQTFEVLHNEAKIPHTILARFPSSLGVDHITVGERHKFLISLGRAQYNPSLPNYVSPEALAQGEDKHFAEVVARSSVGLFNQFLKTL